MDAVTGGKYDLVICDEINNAVHGGLLEETQLAELIEDRSPKTSLCLTGRDFPARLLPLVDIATDMKKIKLGSNFAVFLLFFGVALLEAFQTRNWIKAAFWAAIGIVFLLADNFRNPG